MTVDHFALMAELEAEAASLPIRRTSALLTRAANAIRDLYGGPAVREIPLKIWTRDEADRCGVTHHAIDCRRLRGYYPKLRLRHVNQRVIFVVFPE